MVFQAHEADHSQDLDTLPNRRRLWRSRCLGFDKLFPHCYTCLAHDFAGLRNLMPRCVTIAESGKRQHTEADVDLVFDALDYVTGFIAFLPMQVLHVDSKKLLPRSVSDLVLPGLDPTDHRK